MVYSTDQVEVKVRDAGHPLGAEYALRGMGRTFWDPMDALGESSVLAQR